MEVNQRPSGSQVHVIFYIRYNFIQDHVHKSSNGIYDSSSFGEVTSCPVTWCWAEGQTHSWRRSSLAHPEFLCDHRFLGVEGLCFRCRFHHKDNISPGLVASEQLLSKEFPLSLTPERTGPGLFMASRTQALIKSNGCCRDLTSDLCSLGANSKPLEAGDDLCCWITDLIHNEPLGEELQSCVIHEGTGLTEDWSLFLVKQQHHHALISVFHAWVHCFSRLYCIN